MLTSECTTSHSGTTLMIAKDVESVLLVKTDPSKE
jgi:hypothetical protein